MRFQAPRGTQDMLPSESSKWHYLERTFHQLAAQYGYLEIRTPTFEDRDLFLRTAGETSDVVTKEMYDFVDKGGRNCTLKPEGTAPVMRSVVEHSLCPPGNHLRVRYMSKCFRYGRPQKGRLREHHQFGLEFVGSESFEADAEIIELASTFYRRIGVHDATVLLNSIGRSDCRAKYREVVLNQMASYLGGTDEETRVRAERNPLGLLDSKDPDAKVALEGIPPITDYLETASRARFEKLQERLTEAGVRYELAPTIVRGLDYYTDTVFEVQSGLLGAQSSLCGGGRYDGLIQEVGGSATPSVGVGMGVERMMIVLEALAAYPPDPVPDAFLVIAGEAAGSAGRSLLRELRAAGRTVLWDADGRSMKSQLRQADKSGAPVAILVGEDEVARGEASLRVLGDGTQVAVPLGEVAAWLAARSS